MRQTRTKSSVAPSRKTLRICFPIENFVDFFIFVAPSKNTLYTCCRPIERWNTIRGTRKRWNTIPFNYTVYLDNKATFHSVCQVSASLFCHFQFLLSSFYYILKTVQHFHYLGKKTFYSICTVANFSLGKVFNRQTGAKSRIEEADYAFWDLANIGPEK
jgi:hypothetical protein